MMSGLTNIFLRKEDKRDDDYSEVINKLKRKCLLWRKFDWLKEMTSGDDNAA